MAEDPDRATPPAAGGTPDPRGPPPDPPSAYLEITFLPGGGRPDQRRTLPLDIILRRGPYEEDRYTLTDDFHGLLHGPAGGAPAPSAAVTWDLLRQVMEPGVIYQRHSFNVRYIRLCDGPDPLDPPPPLPHPPGKPGSPPPSPGSPRKQRAVPADHEIRLTEWQDLLNHGDGDSEPERHQGHLLDWPDGDGEKGPQSTRQDPGPSSAWQHEPQPVQFERRPSDSRNAPPLQADGQMPHGSSIHGGGSSEPFQGLKRIAILTITNAPMEEFMSAVNYVMQNTFAGVQNYMRLWRSELPNPPPSHIQNKGLANYLTECCKWLDEVEQLVYFVKYVSTSELVVETKFLFFSHFAAKIEFLHEYMDSTKEDLGGFLGSSSAAPSITTINFDDDRRRWTV